MEVQEATEKEMIQINEDEFARLHNYMIVAKKNRNHTKE